MSNPSLHKALLSGLLILFVLSGCLGAPNIPTNEAGQTTGTTESTPTTEDCPTVVQTDWISSEEVEQANESVIPFEELSELHQELFRRAYDNASYEIKNVSETVVMEIANKIIRYNGSTYRFSVILC